MQVPRIFTRCASWTGNATSTQLANAPRRKENSCNLRSEARFGLCTGIADKHGDTFIGELVVLCEVRRSPSPSDMYTGR